MNIKKIVAIVAMVFVAFGLVACADTKSVKSIEVTGLKVPQHIEVNDTPVINVDNVKVSVTYTDGTTGEVSLSDVQVRGDVRVSNDGKELTLKTDEAGTMTIIISYSGVTTEIKYVVVAKNLPNEVEPVSSGEDGKKGTEEFPFLISNIGNLVWLQNLANYNANSYFQLTQDLDLSGYSWIPIGSVVQEINKGNNGATSFKGTFDGNGFTIKNLLLNNRGNVGSSDKYENFPLQGQAFFASIDGATIKNLTFENAVVNGLEGVSVVAAFATGSVVVDNVKVKGATITGGHWVGGIIGYASTNTLELKNTVVENSTIGAYVYGKDANGDKVGGTIGQITNGTVVATNNKVSDVEVVGFRDMGGFIGTLPNNTNISIKDTVVQNVVLRLDKTQLSNPSFKDGEKADNRWVAAVAGRNSNSAANSFEPFTIVTSNNKFTNVTTFIRLEGKTEYTEYVTKEFGAKAQTGYTAK